ncbi:MAG: CBS domain-containing protein [Actinomycetota bacterium]|nr:CBS domain-containing protein [Actinomycetota bacterium]
MQLSVAHQPHVLLVGTQRLSGGDVVADQESQHKPSYRGRHLTQRRRPDDRQQVERFFPGRGRGGRRSSGRLRFSGGSGLFARLRSFGWRLFRLSPSGEHLGFEIAGELVEDTLRDVARAHRPQDTIVTAAQRMIEEEEKGPLPVVDAGQVVGMMTDRDLVARVVAAGRDPRSVRVGDIDTHDLVTIRPDADVEEARRLMAQHQLDRILVVEEDMHLVGIISEADIRSDEGPVT